MAEQQGWTAVEEPSGWTPVGDAAKPAPHALVRSRTGQLYDQEAANQPGPLVHFGQRLASNLNPVNIASGLGQLVTSAFTDPKAAGRQVIEGIAQPFREIGRGEFPEAAADLSAAALFSRFPGPTGKTGAASAEMLGGVPVADLKSAGIGEQSLKLMRERRPTDVLPTTPPTRGNLALKPQVDDLVQRPTTRVQMGDLIQRPTDTVLARPLSTHDAMAVPKSRGLSVGEEQGIQDLDALQSAIHGEDYAPPGNGLYREPPTEGGSTTPAGPPQKLKLDAVQAARMMRDQFGSEEAARRLYGPVQKQGDSVLQSAADRTAILKRLAEKSTLPDTARTGIDAALASMTPDEAQAYFAKANPIAKKYMRFAKPDLFSEKGSISPALLEKLGLPARYGAAAWASKQAGLPMWSGPAALGVYDVAQRFPGQTQATVRAALLADLANRAAIDTPDRTIGR